MKSYFLIVSLWDCSWDRAYDTVISSKGCLDRIFFFFTLAMFVNFSLPQFPHLLNNVDNKTQVKGFHSKYIKLRIYPSQVSEALSTMKDLTNSTLQVLSSLGYPIAMDWMPIGTPMCTS